MSDINPKLDIWGSPIEGKHECFYCGEYYNLDSSTASNEYRATYCSDICQEKDTLQLKMTAEAEARFSNHIGEPTPSAGDTTEIKVGDFRIKVRKDS